MVWLYDRKEALQQSDSTIWFYLTSDLFVHSVCASINLLTTGKCLFHRNTFLLLLELSLSNLDSYQSLIYCAAIFTITYCLRITYLSDVWIKNHVAKVYSFASPIVIWSSHSLNFILLYTEYHFYCMWFLDSGEVQLFIFLKRRQIHGK